jgi:hypothetical protein
MGIDYGMTGVVLDEEVDLKDYTVWICEIVHGDNMAVYLLE